MAARRDDPDRRISRLASSFRDARRVVFLTGAGMSTESGIPDFRSSTGIYASLTSAQIFDLAAFRQDPAPFFDFARTFFGEMRTAKPNAGHLAITRLQDEWAKHVTVATQNIDQLHQKAGTGTVLALHGTTEWCTCQGCGHQCRTDGLWPHVAAGTVPIHQACGGVFKPDIVFFGEMLPEDALFGAQAAIQRADLLVICGTSLTVYPAAGLPAARREDCRLAIINRTPTPLDGHADFVFRENIGETLSAVLEAMAAPD